ncbi:MAG: ISLre2 family transposase [Bacillota bacterium]
MFKIRQVIMVVLFLAQGIFEALKEAEDFSQLEEQIQKLSQQAAGQLFVEALEEIDQRLLAQKERGLEVVGKRERTLLASFGEITFKRRLYCDQEGKYHILLDQNLGLGPRQRMSNRLMEMSLDLGTEMPFRRAAKVMGYLVPTISAMGIWKVLKESGEVAINEAATLRKAVFEGGKPVEGTEETEVLNIEADEVCVKQQRGPQKNLGLKLVVGYEGKEGKKKCLVNKTTVAGLTNGEGIWEETDCVFSQKWDFEKVKQTRIGGDGAPWIKKGTEHFPNSSYHLDPFHLRKRLCEALNFSSESYEEVCSGIAALDLEKVIEALNKNIKLSRGARRKRVKDLKKYLFLNWGGIAELPEEERLGTIEGQVRHTITRRMKRIGARWTTTGANRMSRLLAAKANGELNSYISGKKDTIKELLEFEPVLKTTSRDKQEDLEAWLSTSMPALSGPHSSRPWIKYILRELAKIEDSA